MLLKFPFCYNKVLLKFYLESKYHEDSKNGISLISQIALGISIHTKKSHTYTDHSQKDCFSKRKKHINHYS